MRYVEQPLHELVPESLFSKLSVWLSDERYCPIGSASPVWFDIETTGLSALSSSVYMIGAIAPSATSDPEPRNWVFRQWFAERPSEEAEVITAFSGSLPEHCALLHFNGTTFDIPFLRDRSRELGLPVTWPSVSVDLYTQLRRLKTPAALASCRQKDLEPYAGYDREDPYDGGELIRFYSEFVGFSKIHKPEAEDRYRDLARHNREDLLGLVSLVRIYDCFALLDGGLDDAELISYNEDAAEFQLLSSLSWPAGLTLSKPLDKLLTLPDRLLGTSLSVAADIDGRPVLRVPFLTEPAKHFYPNFKDYYYLTVEGKVVHKSIASYMDRAYCRPAKRDEAFDWFRGELLPQPFELFAPSFSYGIKDECLLFPGRELPKHPERHTDYVASLLSLFLKSSAKRSSGK